MAALKVNTSVANVAKLTILLALFIRCENAEGQPSGDMPSLVLSEPVDGSTVLPSLQLSMAVTLPSAYNAHDHHVCMEVSSLSFDARSLGCRALDQLTSLHLKDLPYGHIQIRVWLANNRYSATHTINTEFLDYARAIANIVVVPVLPLSSDPTRQPNCIAMKQAKDQIIGSNMKSNTGEFTLCVLVHRGGASFKRAVDTWLTSGLLKMSSERLIFLQEWPPHTCTHSTEAGEDREMCYQSKHSNVDDIRVRDLPSDKQFEVIGRTQQQGIGPALAALIQRAKHKHILFLEEDFAVSLDAAGDPTLTTQRMQEAIALLTHGHADFVKLRSRFQPGAPLYPLIWRGHEHLLTTKHTPYISNHSVLESTHWLDRPDQVFGSQVLWPCEHGPGRTLPKVLSSQTLDLYASGNIKRALPSFCAFSTHAGYSNNPFLASKSFLEAHVVPVALVDWTKSVEAAINLSPNLWDRKCFVVAQTEGMFTHQDIDGRALEKQSPFEDPFASDWLKKRRTALCGGDVSIPMCV